jgi:hypothetical protein
MLWRVVVIIVILLGLTVCDSVKNENGSAEQKPPPIVWVLLASDRNGDLYLIDPSDASATLILDLFTDDGAGGTRDVGLISSMVYDPETGILYAGTSGNNGSPDCRGCLYTIDLTTGEATFVGDPILWGIVGMSIRSDGYLLAMDGDCTSLYLLDKQTGTDLDSADPGQNGCSGNGLTFKLDDTLYMADNGSGSPTIYLLDVTVSATSLTIDTTTPSVLTSIGFGADESSLKAINSMTTHPVTGEAMGIVYTGNPGKRFLVMVDLDSAEMTNLGETNSEIDALVYVPESILP